MGKFQSRSTKKEPQIEVGDKDDEASLSAEETLVDADGLSKSVGSSHKLKDQQRRAQTETTTSEASRDQNVDFALLEDGVTVDINHEYLQDHINALLERENDFIAGITYAMGHPDFNPKDRRIVVNWMIELSYLLQLPPTVIHLAVNIMDRYLSKSSIFKEQLEQIALASMSLASKHETALHPYPRDLLRQAKIDVSQSKLAQIEKEILISLDFRVSYPNPITFVRNASLADDSYLKTRLMSRFFLESFLLDSYFCKFPPSRLASFAFYISLKVLKRGGWGPEFERFTGCSRGALCRSARSMFEHLVNLLRTQDAPFVHYGSLEYHKVSADASNWVKRTETIFSKSI
ncbi:G2/mitotic-specific cyclin [Massospora cicadina]|nr:G2/mitotic-specific cyclin [Massospora cicadina]